MTLLISGSIAFDTIIHTVGTFRENDLSTTEAMNLALFAPRIERENGGTGANIAYSLALLGESPCLIGTYGDDGTPYIDSLSRIGVDTHLTEKREGIYSAQAFIMRDAGGGQINAFHPGAMSDSGNLTHKNESFSHAIVAPDSREGMIRRVDECVEDGIFTIFDPGQAMGIFSPEELIHAVEISHMTAMNE
jgi:adenosine kinase